jgi:hypothetical protein
MRGRHDSYVDRSFPVGADGAHHPTLEDVEQLGLKRERELAELVEEQRSTVRLFEQTGAMSCGAGERALDVSEKFALEQGLR